MFYKNKNKTVIKKKNIAIRIAGKVSRYIDVSMNRATPTVQHFYVRVGFISRVSWQLENREI